MSSIGSWEGRIRVSNPLPQEYGRCASGHERHKEDGAGYPQISFSVSGIFTLSAFLDLFC
jgi:hypothetical protein